MTINDREIIRNLARQVAEEAANPRHEERRRRWYAHNELQAGRPLLYMSPEGAWIELLRDEDLECSDDDARGLERGLRMRLYAAEHFADDQVCDTDFNVPLAVTNTGWGLSPTYTHSNVARGAYVWDAPVKTRADIDLIQTPTATHDPEQSRQNLEYYQELFGDLLNVRLHGRWWWALGLIDEWTNLRGITQTYLDMSDDPKLLHAGMQRLMEGKLAWLQSLEEQNLNSLNNGNDYVGSGAFGYTHELPQADFAGHVRLLDLWGFCEAQTMSEVSPAMHEEFVLQYQLPILKRFGLNCYGCCEPLHLKLDLLKAQVPRLRRVSISPWADKAMSAEKLGGEIIFSWKPNPAAVAGVGFDEDWVRQDVRETVDLARANGCRLEIVLKDTHTCQGNPERFDRWGRIAMEEAEQW
ncbi:MAG: hypothetical protein WCP21_12395 [Armatimonadota bacterium]